MEKKYVYVLTENGAWDYEPTSKLMVFDNFEKALKEFKELVVTAKIDLMSWADENDLSKYEEYSEEHAEFNWYEADCWSKLHDEIIISKQEIL